MPRIPPNVVDDSLLLAVIHSSNAPLVLLDGELTIVAVSQSFSRAFEIDPTRVEGSKLTAIGAGEWNVPQLESLLIATAHKHADIDLYEMDLKRPGRQNRRLVITPRKLTYSDDANTRILVTVMDVTDARVAEKLQRDLLRPP